MYGLIKCCKTVPLYNVTVKHRAGFTCSVCKKTVDFWLTDDHYKSVKNRLFAASIWNESFINNEDINLPFGMILKTGNGTIIRYGNLLIDCPAQSFNNKRNSRFCLFKYNPANVDEHGSVLGLTMINPFSGAYESINFGDYRRSIRPTCFVREWHNSEKNTCGLFLHVNNKSTVTLEELASYFHYIYEDPGIIISDNNDVSNNELLRLIDPFDITW